MFLFHVPTALKKRLPVRGLGEHEYPLTVQQPTFSMCALQKLNCLPAATKEYPEQCCSNRQE